MMIYIKNTDTNKLDEQTKEQFKRSPSKVKLGIPLIQDGYEIYDDTRLTDDDVVEISKEVEVAKDEPIIDKKPE
jgi:predicted regulator of amino acid metabolism with ACT domain